MIPELGGLGLRGPPGKGSPSISKDPKPPIQLLKSLKNSSREVKKGPFSLYIGFPGSHPGNGIHGARGKVPPAPPPPGFSSHVDDVLDIYARWRSKPIVTSLLAGFPFNAVTVILDAPLLLRHDHFGGAVRPASAVQPRKAALSFRKRRAYPFIAEWKVAG